MVVCAVHQIVSFSLLRAHSKMYTFAELHMQVHMLALSKKKKKKTRENKQTLPGEGFKSQCANDCFLFCFLEWLVAEFRLVVALQT